MGRTNTKGTKQLGVELSSSLVDEFREFVKTRGEKVRAVVELALRRHMDNPPPPPPKPEDAPPLPPVTSSEPEKPKAKKRGNKK